MVVLSLSMTTRFARAEILDLDGLELDAEVFGDGLAAGEDGDIAEHGLAAVAEARALTAATLSVPRSLLTTRVASASPSTSSAMMRSGFGSFGDLLEQREQVLHRRDLLLVDQDVGVLRGTLPCALDR